MSVVSVVLFTCLVAGAAPVNGLTFDAQAQAIWLDRFNYFRSTALPWSAGNMRRLGWSSHLAASAAEIAAKCSMDTGKPGVILHACSNSTSSSPSSSLIDDAIQQWVVTTSMATLPTLAQPGASHVEIGTGTYNSYSQVLWATTTTVGCASFSCSNGEKEMLACEFAPAGNDGKSAWYVHADSASECPVGTTASQGFCIVEGDAANTPIAPIPAGMLTYQVYPAYVANMQTVLIEAARAIAGGKPQNVPTASAGATISTPTAATPGALPSKVPAVSDSDDEVGSAIQTAASADKTSSSLRAGVSLLDSNIGLESASTPTDTSEASNVTDGMTGTTKKVVTPSKDSSGELVNEENSQTSSKLPADESLAPGTVKADDDTGNASDVSSKTTDKTTQKPSSPESSEEFETIDKKTEETSSPESSEEFETIDKKMEETSSPESSEESETADKATEETSSSEFFDEFVDDQSSHTSSSSSDDSLVPGTVKANDDIWSSLTNQEDPTQTEPSPEKDPSSSSTSTPSPAPGSSGSAIIIPSVDPDIARSVSNQSSESSQSGFSAAGIAGIIVLGVVAVASFAIVMSYKKNQRRQREIMRDGGIRAI
uniref:SCP domain-containing protein n=1 Tax=Hyaloperonospora arabidopsidis (strain Emoy2) TaxID=559515 RepID=M4BK42_HYAAE